MYSDDSLPSLHLAKAGLVKELLWIKNNDLADYDENSKQLHQEVRTVLNLKWKTPYPQSNYVTNGSTPRSARNKSASSGLFPFTNNELLSMKQSYSHQPNPVELIDDVAEQARKDSYILKRVSELEQAGMMRSKMISKTGRKIKEEGHSTALLAEMEQVSELFAERRREKVETLQSLAEAAHDYHYHIGVEGSRAQREGQSNIQKVARMLTRHVMDFWNQVDELIRLKHTESLRMKEKENMELHLDHLVDQTEKFSTALAIDIQVKGAVNPFEPSFDPEKKPAPLPTWRTDEHNPISTLLSLDSTDNEIDDDDEEDDGFTPENHNSNGWDMSEISEDFSEVDERELSGEEGGQIKTKIPFLLKFQLREYQHLGLDWLATMYDKKLNGILADEMGLGKTIMTISLLAHVATEKGAWGPHLIIVPTSVLLNWDMELRKWCPAFKIISYYGTPKERKIKRQGWNDPNSFHVCITSYQLAIQDQNAFKRRPWHYIILDEAHHIKNSKSQRWQTLLQFKSKRRLLLTGTPIQNNLMELWSLMHFLMPNIFESSSEFKAWFDNPVNSMIEGESEMNFDLIQRLHGILRPFILRRLKSEVEQQLPKKYEHVIFCHLSKRQRGLYEEFIANNNTQSTLKSGSFLGIANVLMQLRKVCNHPDLFEARPILSSFDTIPLTFTTASPLIKILDNTKLDLELDLVSLNLVTKQELTYMQANRQRELKLSKEKIIEIGERIFKEEMEDRPEENPACNSFLKAVREKKIERRQNQLKEIFTRYAEISELDDNTPFLYGGDLLSCCSVNRNIDIVIDQHKKPKCYFDYSNTLRGLVKTNEERATELYDIISRYTFLIPKSRANQIKIHCAHPNVSKKTRFEGCKLLAEERLNKKFKFLHESEVRTQINFPDKSLVQYDCGKLQQLDVLLRKLKREGHRALIFTQMTKMLDVFEVFLNFHGHTYLRLDGSTKVEKRQQMMEWFNSDPKVFLFILSTRAGGLGINLVGADTVIFYDSDWNPAMDQQAQDRCHRIGQTREVHIYHLISQHTIEENIFKKSKQKINLQKTVIKQGNFTTDFFQNVDLQSLIRHGDDDGEPETEIKVVPERVKSEKDLMNILAQAEEIEDASAMKNVLEEQQQIVREFSDDEDQPIKPKKPVVKEEIFESKEEQAYQQEFKRKKRELIASLVGKADWEDSLSKIQQYALHFLQNIDPIFDEQSLIAQHKALAINQQKWEKEHKQQPLPHHQIEDDFDDDRLIYGSMNSTGVESLKNHYETFTPNVLKRLLEEGNNQVDVFMKNKKMKKMNFSDDDDEVDELMEPETSTDYEEEPSFDSDSEVSDNSI